MLTVDMSDLRSIMKQGTGESIILGLRIESESESGTRTVMLKELQFDPINDTYLHADFYEVTMDKELTIDIPLRLVNTPLGAANGGILQHIRRELTVSGLPHELVEQIEVDVSNLDIGDSLHIRDIELPEGISTTLEGHLTIAVMAAPAVAAEVVEEEEEEELGEEAEAATDTEAESEKEE
jgi:large subunit ribosomal protein L25